jgi:hypothetical protein
MKSNDNISIPSLSNDSINTSSSSPSISNSPSRQNEYLEFEPTDGSSFITPPENIYDTLNAILGYSNPPENRLNEIVSESSGSIDSAQNANAKKDLREKENQKSAHDSAQAQESLSTDETLFKSEKSLLKEWLHLQNLFHAIEQHHAEIIQEVESSQISFSWYEPVIRRLDERSLVQWETLVNINHELQYLITCMMNQDPTFTEAAVPSSPDVQNHFGYSGKTPTAQRHDCEESLPPMSDVDSRHNSCKGHSPAALDHETLNLHFEDCRNFKVCFHGHSPSARSHLSTSSQKDCRRNSESPEPSPAINLWI